MADEKRIEELVAAVVERRIEESLVRAEAAIASWRRGETTLLAANTETLRHAARVSALSLRVAGAEANGVAPLLRDALELGLLDAAEFRALTGKSPAEVPAPRSLDEAASEHGQPGKREVMDRLLGDGPVLVHLDARRAGVVVPPRHAGSRRLVLRFGRQLSPPIPDLEVDDAGLSGTLTFQGQPHRCVIPWAAVFAISDEQGKGMVWSEDIPADIDEEEPEPEAPGPSSGPKGTKRRGHLKLVN